MGSGGALQIRLCKPGAWPACLSVFLGASCLIVLAVLGVEIVMPYNNVLNYQETTCSVVGNFTQAWDTVVWLGCRCGGGCQSEVPCVYVQAEWQLPRKGTVTTRLYDTDHQLVHDGCSYETECEEDKYSSRQKAKTWLGKLFSSNDSFSCLYDSAYGAERGVILTKKYNADSVLHAMLWPALGLAVALVGFPLACIRFRRMAKQKAAAANQGTNNGHRTCNS